MKATWKTQFAGVTSGAKQTRAAQSLERPFWSGELYSVPSAVLLLGPASPEVVFAPGASSPAGAQPASTVAKAMVSREKIKSFFIRIILLTCSQTATTRSHVARHWPSRATRNLLTIAMGHLLHPESRASSRSYALPCRAIGKWRLGPWLRSAYWLSQYGSYPSHGRLVYRSSF